MHPIQKVLEAKGYHCRSYQGRGMSHECLAVECSDSLGVLMSRIIEQVVLDSAEEADDAHKVAMAVRTMREDTLGKKMIVYFPSVEYTGSDQDDTDEEDD